MNKKKLSYEEQIQHLKSKGISFDAMSETDALAYLKSNNNFFKLKSYRKLFNKDKNKDRYVHLEFAYLVDLAIIDTRLRRIIVEMALNIEHFTKVALIGRITECPEDDGYKIVKEYLRSLDPTQRKILKGELQKSLNSPYCKDLYSHYEGNMPIWVFTELLSFGSYIYFYLFCAKHFRDKAMKEHAFIMKKVKTIRNAAAHNNCILNCLKSKTNPHDPSVLLVNALKDSGFSRDIRRSKLKNETTEQILSCFYAHKLLVTSSGVNKHMARELNEFKNRLTRGFTYEDNLLIKSTWNLFERVIDSWYPLS
ncbi:Abi family protein [Allisonella histaminiformans]|uniref:Abi family protein n=1 Tax=Allisonella histaminiformans TaxID=209880 RepID=UPI0022E86EDA|nr:Abi family protein [Allisonella histaminiformans]